MCIILYNENGKKLDKNRLETAYNNNPHGYGVMWNEGGRVNTVKGLCDFDQIWQLTKMLEGTTYALHFRWQTMGDISEARCHPFEVLTKDQHGLDLVMMHNGTIFSLPKDKEKSDTQIFAERFSSKILEKDPEFKFDYFHKIDSAIGLHNKMIFMSSDNRTFFVNKNNGVNIEGIWYSNTYSFEKGYRTKKTYFKEVTSERVEKHVRRSMHKNRVIRRKFDNDTLQYKYLML